MRLLLLSLCLQLNQIQCRRRFYLSCNNLLYSENNNTHRTIYRFACFHTNNICLIYIQCCTFDYMRVLSLGLVEPSAQAMTRRILYSLLYALHNSHIFHLGACKSFLDCMRNCLVQLRNCILRCTFYRLGRHLRLNTWLSLSFAIDCLFDILRNDNISILRRMCVNYLVSGLPK